MHVTTAVIDGGAMRDHTLTLPELVSLLEQYEPPEAERAGRGFIGSHLTELLLADGWEVYALDDLSTGPQENVAHLRERDFHLVVDSVLSPPSSASSSTSATSSTTSPRRSACA